VAGQLLKSLKNGSGSRPAVSHEAKLGVMVITILVFAFCFLVYHKMDMYQQQLTQASIPSTAGSAAGAVAGADATSTGGTSAHALQETSGTDPLLHSDRLTEALQIPASEITFDEPSALMEPAVDENEPDEQSPFLVAQEAVSDSSASLELSDPEFDGAEERIASGAEQSRGEGSGGGTLVEAQSEITFDTTAEPDLSELDPTAGEFVKQDSAPTEFEAQGPSELIALSNSQEFAGESPIQDSVDSTTADSESAAAAATETQREEPEFADTANDQSTEEPMLLAMAEPVQGSAFADGFGSLPRTADPEISVRNDVSESEISFSAVDSADTRMALAAQDRSTLGPGFDAVTRPSSRTGNRNPIRTAAGSGADGKFSLAAFNYQNNSAEPAPDDGTTFDSTRVQDGENYTTISKRVYGSGRYFSALAVFNQHRIPEPKKMRPGMLVLTPPVDVLVARYPQLFEDLHSKTVEPAEFLILEDNSPAYRVGERETLSEISERFLGRSARWVEIYRLNQSIVNDPNKLKPGTILALPADAVEVSVKP
jgi:nucleoid-associated protein YgaU